MKKQLAELLLATAMLGAATPTKERELSTEPPNGNSRRKHKENVKRRKLRRLKSAAKKLNRKK